jgi:hypothetical protein
MIALRTNFEYWGYKSGYWQWHAERTRRYAEQVRERAEHATHSLSTRRILNLAKRYERMANLAEERVKKHDRNI